MASGWERIYRQDGDLGFGVLPKIARAAKLLREKDCRTILDLGCGTGRHSIFLAQLGFLVQATDLSPTGIRIAEEKARSLDAHNLHFGQHDMKMIPFSRESFDAVICTWTVYHATLSGIQGTIAEIYRVLRPEGLLITDFLSTHDCTYGLGREIEPNTFVGQKAGEEDVPHHYSTRGELTELLRQFRQSKIRAHSRRYVAEGMEYTRNYFDVEAVK